jgi:hypothetical protein
MASEGERRARNRGARRGEGDESVLWDRAANERGELRGWALACGLGPGRASRGRDRPVRGRKGKGSGWTRGKGSGPGSYWARGERREGELAGLFLEFWAGWGFGFTLFLFLLYFYFKTNQTHLNSNSNLNSKHTHSIKNYAPA